MSDGVASETATSGTASGTEKAAFLPSTINAGDLLFLFMVLVGGSGKTISSVVDSTSDAWEELVGFTDERFLVYTKVADGDEGSGTVTVTMSASVDAFAAYTGRVKAEDWFGNTVDGLAVSSGVSFTGTSADAPAVTAPWGAVDNNLFIPIMGCIDDGETVSGFPSGYSDTTSTMIGSSNNGATAAMCEKLSSNATEDPGTFTLGGSQDGNSYTLLVRPELATLGSSSSTTTNLAALLLGDILPE